MCGIGGFFRFGKKPIDPEKVTMLLTCMESRGNDATGISVMGFDGGIATLKDDDPAWEFSTTESYKTFLEEHVTDKAEIVLLHTRAATKGTPRKNENNHPLTTGQAAIVHNGIISNDDFLFRDLKLKRGAETDSDIIRAIVDEFGINKESVEMLNKMSGSCATAAISPKTPGTLLLARSGSPVVVGYSDEEDQLMFASEKDMIHTASRPYIERKGLWFQSNKTPLSFQTMANDSAWIIGRKGLEWHGKFVTCRSYTSPSYRIHERYNEKNSRWDDEMEKALAEIQAEQAKEETKLPADKVRCPNKKCGKILRVPVELKAKPLHELHCQSCNTMLAPEPEKRHKVKA